MKTRRIAILISLLLIGLLATSPTIALAQSQTPSVLSRLQVVEDPELGELIRAAIEYRRQYYSGVDLEKELEIVRKITESYAQIKLLDRQIELLDKKVRENVPDELQYELILAQAELEAKRTTELATLREVICVMPDYPLGPQPDWKLKACLRLDVIDSRVYVTEALRPFSGRPTGMSYVPGKLMTKTQALEAVKKRLTQKDALPIRIDIFRNAMGVTLSQEIEKDVIELILKTGVGMQAEVHLDDSAHQTPNQVALYLERGRIATGTHYSSNRFPQVELQGSLDPNEVKPYLRGQLLRPGALPAMITIVHAPGDEKLVDKMVEIAERCIHELNLGECVEVKNTAEEVDPARRFLGQWKATYEGEDLIVTINESSRCSIGDGESRPMYISWSYLKEGKISIDSQGGAGLRHAIPGHINAEGNLVLELYANEAPITFMRID